MPEDRSALAKSIRKILYPDLTDQDVNCITIVLLCHLMIENRAVKLLHNWMENSVPEMGGTGDKMFEVRNKEVRERILKNIERMSFAYKIKLIKPLAMALWGPDAQYNLKDIWDINDLRNDIFHRMNIKEVKFRDKLLTSEDCIEKLVDLTQHVLDNIDHLIELIEK